MKHIVLALLSVLLVPAASAQMQVARIRVKVLNGHSGKPVRKAQAFAMMLPETTFSSPIEFTTDRTGTASLLLVTTGQVAITVPHHATCEYRRKADRKKLGPGAYPVQEILSTGLIGKDHCGHPNVKPTPGELVVFVRPSHWWQRIAY